MKFKVGDRVELDYQGLHAIGYVMDEKFMHEYSGSFLIRLVSVLSGGQKGWNEHEFNGHPLAHNPLGYWHCPSDKMKKLGGQLELEF
jgi:hypothetical protein